MATAESTTIEVRQEVRGFTLTLTEDEAATLRDIGARTGGNPETSRRRHVDAINKALDSAGVQRRNDWRTGNGDIKQGLLFANEGTVSDERADW